MSVRFKSPKGGIHANSKSALTPPDRKPLAHAISSKSTLFSFFKRTSQPADKNEPSSNVPAPEVPKVPPAADDFKDRAGDPVPLSTSSPGSKKRKVADLPSKTLEQIGDTDESSKLPNESSLRIPEAEPSNDSLSSLELDTTNTADDGQINFSTDEIDEQVHSDKTHVGDHLDSEMISKIYESEDSGDEDRMLRELLDPAEAASQDECEQTVSEPLLRQRKPCPDPADQEGPALRKHTPDADKRHFGKVDSLKAQPAPHFPVAPS